MKLLKELSLGAKKRYGQNFLIDERVLSKIINGAGITKDDTVLEIGPGVGTMTQALAKSAGKVIAVEIDKDLIPVLGKTLSGFDNVCVINDDILNVDIGKLTGEECRKIKVVANLPYYITTPIIMKLLEGDAPIESITVMVQKEVADRMEASPGGKDYGALSVAVNYYTVPEIIAKVPSNCFIPRPGVDSAVINLKLRDDPRRIISGGTEIYVKDPAEMFRVVKLAFSQRRKTLVNTLKGDFEKEKILKALKELGLGEDIRGEKLSVAEFALLAEKL